MRGNEKAWESLADWFLLSVSGSYIDESSQKNGPRHVHLRRGKQQGHAESESYIVNGFNFKFGGSKCICSMHPNRK